MQDIRTFLLTDKETVELTKFTQVPIEMELKLDTSLDNATLKLYVEDGDILGQSADTDFKHFAKIEIHVDGIIHRWVVIDQNYTEVDNARGKKGGFRQLTLIEPTKLLERITLPNMSVTQAKVKNDRAGSMFSLDSNSKNNYKLEPVSLLARSETVFGFQLEQIKTGLLDINSSLSEIPFSLDFSTTSDNLNGRNILVPQGLYRIEIALDLVNGSYGIMFNEPAGTAEYAKTDILVKILGRQSGNLYYSNQYTISRSEKSGFFIAKGTYSRLSITENLEIINKSNGQDELYVTIESTRTDSSAKLDSYTNSVIVTGASFSITFAESTETTTIGSTLADVVEKAILAGFSFDIRKTNLNPYRLSSTARNSLANIKAPEKIYENATLWDVLLESASYVNAIPRLGSTDWSTITFDSISNRKQDREILYYSKDVNKSSSQYASHVRVSASNGVEGQDGQTGEYGEYVEDPYAKGFTSVRSESIFDKLSETSAIIKTSYPIYTIKELNVIGVSLGSETYTESNPLNIASQVVPYEAYLAFEDLTSFSNTSITLLNGEYKNNHIYFNRGNPSIKGLGRTPQQVSLDLTQEKQAIYNAILSAHYKQTGETGLSFTLDDLFQNLGFNIKYVAFEPIETLTIRDDLEEGEPESELYLIEKATEVDIRNIGSVALANLNRKGIPIHTLANIAYDINNVPVIGDTVNGLVVTNVSMSVENTHISYSLYLCALTPYINDFIGIDSKVRSYQVPATGYIQRIDIEESNFSFVDVTDMELVDIKNKYDIHKFKSATSQLMLSFLALLYSSGQPNNIVSSTTVLKEDVLGSLSASSARVANIGIALTEQKWNATGYDYILALPVNVSTVATTLNFMFNFMDNYAAGTKLVERTASNVPYYIEEHVRYTDYFGTFYAIDIVLTNNREIEDNPISLPEVNYFVSGFTSILFRNKLKSFKDSKEAYGVSNSVTTKGMGNLTVYPELVNVSPALTPINFDSGANTIDSNVVVLGIVDPSYIFDGTIKMSSCTEGKAVRMEVDKVDLDNATLDEKTHNCAYIADMAVSMYDETTDSSVFTIYGLIFATKENINGANIYKPMLHIDRELAVDDYYDFNIKLLIY